jgi:hypothetical protein
MLYDEMAAALRAAGYLPAGVHGFYDFTSRHWIEEPQSENDVYEILRLVGQPADEDPDSTAEYDEP